MKVEGEAALLYHAVRLDTLEDAHAGPLVSADDITGEIQWKDKAGEVKSVTLGQHAIKILPKGSR